MVKSKQKKKKLYTFNVTFEDVEMEATSWKQAESNLLGYNHGNWGSYHVERLEENDIE